MIVIPVRIIDTEDGQAIEPGQDFRQRILDGIFVLCGIFVMVQFIRNAHRIEPFTARA